MHAMVGQIKLLKGKASSSSSSSAADSTGFDDVIKRHFFTKRDEIKLQLAGWKEEASSSSLRCQLEQVEELLYPLLNELQL